MTHDFNYEFQKPLFTRTLLTGVFVGIITTLVCLFYDVLFRESTGFSLGPIINVSTLIFVVNLIFLVISLVYYAFLKIFKKDLLFIIVFSLLTLFFVWKALGVHRSPDQHLNTEFKELLLGVIIIMGVAASFFIPYLFHSRKFEEHVL